MNTPAHIAASLFVWKKSSNPWAAWALAAGAILPDAPMFVFYAYQKYVGSSEKLIWSELYFRENWQLFFDLFNSIPLTLILAWIGLQIRQRNLQLLAYSMLLHLVCDFVCHNDDAHRHFLPLTNWRFQSPVSYWDPQHFGHIFFVCELVAAVSACVAVWKFGVSKALQRWGLAVLAVYAVALSAAAVFWLKSVL